MVLFAFTVAIWAIIIVFLKDCGCKECTSLLRESAYLKNFHKKVSVQLSSPLNSNNCMGNMLRYLENCKVFN